MTLKDHSTLSATKAAPPITAVKASLFTLVIFVENQARKAFFDSLVDTIMPYFPCRVIAIITGKKGSLNCEHTTKTVRLGKKAILCDIFTITSSYNELDQVPFTLLPLLRPDLPIHLLWAEDLSVTPAIFSELKKISCRLIFDSMATPNLFEFARSFINKENEFPNHIVDLTWARLSGWRHIMAETFNSAQKIDQLKNTHKIDLAYNSRTTDHFTRPEYTSFQLIAWLASQLNWTFQSKTDEKMVFKRDNQEIHITIRPENKPQFDPGTLLLLDITTNSGHNYTFLRETIEREVSIKISTPQHCEVPYLLPFSSLQREQSLMQEMFYSPHSSHYRNLLQTLATIR